MPKACTAYAQPQPTRCDFAVSEGWCVSIELKHKTRLGRIEFVGPLPHDPRAYLSSSPRSWGRGVPGRMRAQSATAQRAAARDRSGGVSVGA